ASELGRLTTISALPPSFSHSAPTFFSASAPFAQITTLAPAPASVFDAIAPNAPEAPVMIAVLPLTLNSDSGSFRKSSDMTDSPLVRDYPRHPEVRTKRASKGRRPGWCRHPSRAACGRHLRMTLT